MAETLFKKEGDSYIAVDNIDSVKHVSTSANDVKLSRDLYAQAFDKAMNLSQYLEVIDPSDADDKLDAFERQLKKAGIRTKHDYDRGISASNGEYFFQSNMPESRIMFPEYLSRVARQALMNEENNIQYLVASWENITGNGTYRSIYIDDTEAKRTKSRVGEGAEFPTVTVSWSEKATTLKKYGVRLKMSYEFVRRASLPIIEMVVAREMIQNRMDEVEMALAVIINGDGNSKEGAVAGNSNLSTLGVSGPTSTANLTYASWLAWLLKFFPGRARTVVMNSTDYPLYRNMARPQYEPYWAYAQILKGSGEGRPNFVNTRVEDNVNVIIHDSLTTNILVGLDSAYGIIGYRESNTDLTETNKIINGQWDEMVISNTIGFSKLFNSACKTLTTSA